MHIKRIELCNFRNHQHLVLDEVGNVLIIIGDNAAGKTNIIEALQLLSMHESFRQPKNEELILKNQEKEITSLSIDINTLQSVNTKQLIIDQGTRTFLYNKKEKPAKDLLDEVPSVLFTPDDLYLIKGPPEQRRSLLDSLGSRLSKSFSQIRNEYYKSLRQKNSLLKQEEVNLELLDSWNINLAKLGTSLTKHRFGLFEQLLEITTKIYKGISGGEVLTGAYIAYGENSDDAQEEKGEIKEALKNTQVKELKKELYEIITKKREAEIKARRSLVGSQKDDIHFYINNQDTRRYASQGQQRSVALALKMAEIEILKRVKAKEPLLLLDDVMSELDETRRNFFVELIGEESQVVLTTTNLSYFNKEFLSRATVVELEKSTTHHLKTEENKR